VKDTKRDAMKDFIAAVKAGDAAKAALAFERAYEACAYEDEDEEVTESKEN
jgi:ribosomal protein S20